MHRKRKKIDLRNQRHSGIGIVYLGLLAVLAIYVLARKRDRGQLDSPTNMDKSPQTNTPQPPNQLQDAIDKLDSIKKEIALGTYIAISALAFAFMVYAVQALLNNQILNGSIGLILSLVMFSFGEPKVRKRVGEFSRRFHRLINYTLYIAWGILLVIALYILIRLISHM